MQDHRWDVHISKPNTNWSRLEAIEISKGDKGKEMKQIPKKMGKIK
jgi:hypothetical protein